jgi:hypothetical protein
MIGLLAGTRIWIAAGVTDMRRGFHGLSAQVQTVLEQQPLSGHVCLSWSTWRHRKGALVRWRRTLPAGQAARAGTLCVVSGVEWHRISEPCAVVDVARRDRLASTASDGRTGDECLSDPYSIYAGYLLIDWLICAILRTCLRTSTCPIWMPSIRQR